MTNRCHFGDVFDVLPRLAGLGARCCVTSPPYWGLRDYGTATWHGGDPNCGHEINRWCGKKDGQARQSRNVAASDRLDRVFCARCGARRVDQQIGLEQTPEEYVEHIVRVFRLVWDCLTNDGTLWLNLGDCYAGTRHSDDALEEYGLKHGMGGAHKVCESRRRDNAQIPRSDRKLPGLKPKDLVGIPWMVAFALRTDGWYLRRPIIWHKPNPMPESVKDRPTASHEYLFLMSKRERYYYDAEAIKEPDTGQDHARLILDGQASLEPSGGLLPAHGGLRTPGGRNGFGRNRRDVWTVATTPYPRAHFATYPPALIKPCILAGSAPGDIVIDPFLGSGTTAAVAQSLGRRWVGCELNEDYKQLQDERISQIGLELGGEGA